MPKFTKKCMMRLSVYNLTIRKEKKKEKKSKEKRRKETKRKALVA